ncbi:PH domain-containing protein [Allopontixanthobacter sp.]|uniref:PH domain-containing protein n=1 Tax=Allopontixanthobacter sp. TaxID=2906452 RepID=UPI002ABCDBE5|nr:PH domain-containing protein [Allopontixanthobacter sp.]MDZ4307096.1 PH domain-containing protein [Allopontixanthobacter sp.]
MGFVAQGLQGLQRAVLPMIAVAYGMRDESFGLFAALGLGLVIAAVGGGLAYLNWRRLTYTVGETDIRVESGILSRAARSVPFERIQDVSLEQTLLPRLFGLVQVRFETGAGGKDELSLRYLSEEEGERLRDVVRARKDGADAENSAVAAESADAETTVEEPARVLFAMDLRRLLTFGMFEFSLAVVAVVGGALQTFGDFLPFDIWELEEWQRVFAGPFGQLESLGRTARIMGGILGVVSLLAVGVATGVVRTVLRDWGFLLERTAKGFRRRRGLLTRTDVVMPVHRVQAVRIGTGLVRGRFGWHALSFVSLAQDSGSSNHVVAPFGQMDELRPIIAEAGFEPPPEDLVWQRGAANARIDSAVASAVLLAPVAIAAILLGRPWLALLPVAAAVFLGLRQAYLWRFERHALSPAQLFVGSGWLVPKLSIASRVKLQSVEISQHILGRWRGYATLHLGLAGGTLSIGGIPVPRAEELRSAVLSSIARTDFSELGQ